MTSQKNYLVFLCYGNKGVFHECAYSLLSLSRLYKPEELNNWEIWIYTDKPEWFQKFHDCWLPLHYRKIEENTILQWKGSIHFVHRVKIEVLNDLVQGRNGNILYLDTDTVFMQRIDTMLAGIESGKLYMHVSEGVVSSRSNLIFEKLDKHLRTDVPIMIKGKPIYDLQMWNAGVIGFNTKYRHLLEEVLAFTDVQYPAFPKHIMEQFAFSVYFQQTGAINSAAPYLIHYWNLKEARHLFQEFFKHHQETNWTDLAVASNQIQIPVIMQDKINFLLNQTLIDKVRRKKWAPQQKDS